MVFLTYAGGFMNARGISIRVILPLIFLVTISCGVSTDLTQGIDDYNYEMSVSLSSSLSGTAYFNNDKYQVTITSNRSGAVIYYTIDGTDPSTTNGSTYTLPVDISATTEVRAMAYYNGNVSPVGSITVTITADGTSANPYFIANETHLNNLATLVNAGNTAYNDKFYVQIANIDLSAYSSGTGWTPIGTSTNPFKGSFNGQNGVTQYQISNMTINDPTGNYKGLFGYISGATVQNVLIDTISVTGNSDVGSLAGTIYDSTVTGCTVSNISISGTTENIGGFAGSIQSSPTITGCQSNGTINSQGIITGGFAGLINLSTVGYCHAAGGITSYAVNTGGFAGMVQTSAIENCYATSSIQAYAGNSGGFAGLTIGDLSTTTYLTISACYATGSVTENTATAKNTGGFIGYIDKFCNIDNCNSQGNVNSSGENTGGFAGSSTGYYATLIYMTSVNMCYSTGTVSSGSKNTGGFIGSVELCSNIVKCYSEGVVWSTAENTGGFAGSSTGYYDSTIPLNIQTKITRCYSKGVVNSTADYTGGFIGYISSSAVLDSYSVSNVSSSGQYYGGFIGTDTTVLTYTSTITNCFYAGTISSGTYDGGGFIGNNNDSIFFTYCFWLKDSSINDTLFDTIGLFKDILTIENKLAIDMANQDTFTTSPVNWDFSTIWTMGTSYPLLQ